jgi:inhibitor of KinA
MRESYRSNAQDFLILPFGDAALTVEFGEEIDPAINERVMAFAEIVRTQMWKGLLDVVPTYRSVTIHVDPLCLDIDALTDRLHNLQIPAQRTTSSGREHSIPVLYGGEAGPDIQEVAAFAKLSVDEVIRLHASVHYRVYMLGFSPGFPYLGLVPDTIAMPRRPTPRISVPAGSVGIAGNQTGIYPISTPGGWQLIGRTSVVLYPQHGAARFLLHPGDLVRFEPITAQDFDRLQREQT